MSICSVLNVTSTNAVGYIRHLRDHLAEIKLSVTLKVKLLFKNVKYCNTVKFN